MIKNLKRQVRVLYVIKGLVRGGVETWIMDVMRNTTRKEFQFDVCLTGCVKGPYEDEFKKLGGRIFCCPLGKNLWKFSSSFKNLLYREHYDIVHSHLYFFSGFVLRLAFKYGVAKRIAHIHPVEDFKTGGIFRFFYKFLMKRWISRYGTSFVGPTQASLAAFFGPAWRDDPTKHVIYNGICTDRFLKPVDRRKVRRELGIPEDAPIVINVSSFRPHKRHEFLVQVAEHVLAQRQDVYFLLIGAGALKKAIEEQVRRKRLADHFRFISGRPNIDSYWLAADVFAFPSCNEGFGIVIIEAALAGLRIVAQDIPGVREAAAGCIDPILLPLSTPAGEWAQSVLNAIRQPRMPETQRHKLLKEFPFTIENSIKKLRGIYYG